MNMSDSVLTIFTSQTFGGAANAADVRSDAAAAPLDHDGYAEREEDDAEVEEDALAGDSDADEGRAECDERDRAP